MDEKELRRLAGLKPLLESRLDQYMGKTLTFTQNVYQLIPDDLGSEPIIMGEKEFLKDHLYIKKGTKIKLNDEHEFGNFIEDESGEYIFTLDMLESIELGRLARFSK